MVDPLLCAVVCVVAVVAFNWWYRSRKLDIRYNDLYVLITGCDTGFGRSAAIKFDHLGFNVFAACYSREKETELSSLCSSRLCTLPLDVTSEASVEKALEIVKDRLPAGKGLWAVINNAGIMGTFGAIEWFKRKHYMETLSVNLLGMVSVTKTFLPLVRQCQGRIVITSSAVGRFPIFPAVYSVSKCCVEGWANCLRHDLWNQGVSVHLVEPGGYRTKITDINFLGGTLEKAFDELDEYTKVLYGDKFKNGVWHLLNLTGQPGVFGSNLHEVADVYLHAVTARHPKTRYVVGLNGNLVFRPMWMLPVRLADFIMGMVIPQPGGLSKAG